MINETVKKYLGGLNKIKCRIGITTDLKERKVRWKTDEPTMDKWKVLETYDTKDEAQKAETRLAKKYKCVAHQGGRDPDDPKAKWYVYYFEYE